MGKPCPAPCRPSGDGPWRDGAGAGSGPAGVADGDVAALVSPRGRFEVRVRVDPTLRPDIVVVPKGGWHKHGRNMNVLIEPRFTAGTGSAFNQNFVRLEAVGRPAPR